MNLWFGGGARRVEGPSFLHSSFLLPSPNPTTPGRYVPTVVAAASLISYYGTAPLIMAATGVDRVTANGIALGSIGPLLAPLYARQEGASGGRQGRTRSGFRR